MLKITLVKPEAVSSRADLLAVPVFAGLELGPGAEEAVAALDAPVTPLLEARGFTGKAGDALALPTLGRLPATTLLLIGVGVLLFTNYMPYLNAYFISLTPQWLLERL